jgi:hypothetical protein
MLRADGNWPNSIPWTLLAENAVSGSMLRRVRPQEQVATHQRHVRRGEAQPAREGLGQLVAELHLAQLDVAGVVDGRLLVAVQPAEIRLRADARGVRLAVGLTDPVHQDARIAGVVLPAFQRALEDARVVAEVVRHAEDVPPCCMSNRTLRSKFR